MTERIRKIEAEIEELADRLVMDFSFGWAASYDARIRALEAERDALLARVA